MNVSIPSGANAITVAFKLDASDPSLCKEIDPHLAERLKTLNDLKDIYFYLRCGDLCNVMTETRNKVNDLLLDYLENSDVNWKLFEKLNRWLDNSVKGKLVDIWLDSEDVNPDSMWIGESIPSDHKENVKALKRFVDIYRANRSNDNLTIIESLFKNIGSDKLGEACDVIAKSTPAIACILLCREQVSDDYTIKGLKAMSKLSKQRSVEVKIDFDMLKHLGPRGRLDAMKQLLGMMNKWGSKKRELPFKSLPTREEVEFFLFPCSIKYNEEVVELVNHFLQLTGQKEVTNG